MANAQNKSLKEHIQEAENNEENIYFDQISKRCFYLFNDDRWEVNKIIDKR
jgi:hypothetical protein